MAETATKPTSKKPEIVCDASEWRMGQYADFLDAMRLGNVNAMFKVMATGIKSWSFREVGSPDDPASFRNLKPEDWSVVLEVFQDHLTHIFR